LILPATGSAVLKAAPGDEDAVRCKVTAHIKARKMDEALAAMRAAEHLPIDFTYYKVIAV
jgi:signal recognition particle subunit SRP72